MRRVDGAVRFMIGRPVVGRTESVAFEGYTTSLREVMAGAACGISTTGREAMPLALLETAAVGTPVVVYDIRYGSREVILDGINGFVISAHDIKAAAGSRSVAERTRPSGADVAVCARGDHPPQP